MQVFEKPVEDGICAPKKGLGFDVVVVATYVLVIGRREWVQVQ